MTAAGIAKVPWRLLLFRNESKIRDDAVDGSGQDLDRYVTLGEGDVRWCSRALDRALSSQE